MSRNRHITNARGGMEGSIIRGDVIYTTLQGGVGIGGVGQGIDTASTTQRYDFGTRLVTGDGRVFRYAKAGNTISITDYGAKFWRQIGDGIATSAGGSSAIGDMTVTLTGTATKNEYTGGYLITHTSPIQNRSIVSNTATVGTTFVITLAEPLNVAIVSGSSYVEALQSPYSDVRVQCTDNGTTGDDYSGVAGVPFTVTTAANQFLWIQTWGPRWINPWGDQLQDAGITGGERQVVFDSEGHICIESEAAHGPGAGSNDQQVAGFIIDRSASGVSGPPLIMLQISP